MTIRYVALLRAITNVSQAPFRTGMEELGFADVVSFGMSGNLIFSAPQTSAALLEDRVTKWLGALAIIRTASELSAAAKANPFADTPGSTVIFLARPPSADKRRMFATLEFNSPGPVLKAQTAYCVWPLTLQSKKAVFDVEKALGVRCTMRTSRVVKRLAELATNSRGG